MSKSPSYIGLLNITLSLEGSEMELKVAGPMFSFPEDADAIGGALADGLRGIFHCKPKAEAPAFHSTPFTIEEVQDAARFRWLCDPNLVTYSGARNARDKVCHHMMNGGSLAAVRGLIDEAMAIWHKNPKPATEPGK